MLTILSPKRKKCMRNESIKKTLKIKYDHNISLSSSVCMTYVTLYGNMCFLFF